jgi:hypothetical protein
LGLKGGLPLSLTGDYYRIGRRRISKKKIKKRFYQFISFVIMFLFLSSLVVIILTGQKF